MLGGLLALAAGRGGDANKAGGERPARPIVLTMTNGATEVEELFAFVDAVARLSG